MSDIRSSAESKPRENTYGALILGDEATVCALFGFGVCDEFCGGLERCCDGVDGVFGFVGQL